MRHLLAIFGVFLWPSLAMAQLALPPELCLPAVAAEQRLWDDLADGRLDEHGILEAALIAEGAEEAETSECVKRVSDRLASWRADGVLDGTPRQRAEKLFDLMHKDLLAGGYRQDASDLAEAIQHGRFNCVSTTLLWQHLAAELEVPAVARQLPGHVQSVLSVGEARIIVETTCPRWFALVDDEGRPRAASIAWDGVPAVSATAGEARELDDAALIASVYYNRGLALLGRREFAAALAATHAAHRLDPANAAARTNVLATLNNWALHLAEHGQTARAIWLLETGQGIAADHESFQVNLALLRGATSGNREDASGLLP